MTDQQFLAPSASADNCAIHPLLMGGIEYMLVSNSSSAESAQDFDDFSVMLVHNLKTFRTINNEIELQSCV